ncbi:MAG: HypC/HybG/HupF family hydrogenase formation chaperone [Dehalococcoidia bacterium]
MCLAIPARLFQIEGERGLVELAGVVREVSLMLLPEARIGDYLLIHAGYALQRLDEADAQETLRLLEEVAQAGQEEA